MVHQVFTWTISSSVTSYRFVVIDNAYFLISVLNGQSVAHWGYSCDSYAEACATATRRMEKYEANGYVWSAVLTLSHTETDLDALVSGVRAKTLTAVEELDTIFNIAREFGEVVA